MGFASFSLTSSSFSPLERRPVCCVATRPQHGKKISATNLSYSGYFLNRAKLQLRSRGCFINLDSNSTSLGKRRDFIRSLRSTKSWRTKRQQGNNCFQENLEPGIKFRSLSLPSLFYSSLCPSFTRCHCRQLLSSHSDSSQLCISHISPPGRHWFFYNYSLKNPMEDLRLANSGSYICTCTKRLWQKGKRHSTIRFRSLSCHVKDSRGGPRDGRTASWVP